MKLLINTIAALLLASGCTAIPINLPKDDEAAPTAELGGGFDAGASDDKGLSLDYAYAPDIGPVPPGDAGVGDALLDGRPTDAVGEGQPTDAVGEAQLADAVGEGIAGDGLPPPAEGGAVDDGKPEG